MKKAVHIISVWLILILSILIFTAGITLAYENTAQYGFAKTSPPVYYTRTDDQLTVTVFGESLTLSREIIHESAKLVRRNIDSLLPCIYQQTLGLV